MDSGFRAVAFAPGMFQDLEDFSKQSGYVARSTYMWMVQGVPIRVWRFLEMKFKLGKTSGVKELEPYTSFDEMRQKLTHS